MTIYITGDLSFLTKRCQSRRGIQTDFITDIFMNGIVPNIVLILSCVLTVTAFDSNRLSHFNKGMCEQW